MRPLFFDYCDIRKPVRGNNASCWIHFNQQDPVCPADLPVCDYKAAILPDTLVSGAISAPIVLIVGVVPPEEKKPFHKLRRSSILGQRTYLYSVTSFQAGSIVRGRVSPIGIAASAKWNNG